MAVKDYSTNPDDNITISGINIAEGCAPSGINNAIRQLMADVKVDHDAQESTNTELAKVMTGATASAAGESGNVPAPQSGQNDFFLLGNAKWGKLSEQPDFVDLADRVTEAESKTGLPLGHIFTWPFSTPPDGSIVVNGATYSRELYSDLWTYLSSHTSWIKTDEEWQSIASANNGYCPYFSSGDGSSTFRVPKFAPYQQIAISAANAGMYHEAGLPEIYGSTGYEQGDLPLSGSFYASNERAERVRDFSAMSTKDVAKFAASLSSDKYGKSDTVQPESHEWIICVVAFGKATNVGEVDVANVMAAVGVVQADVATRLPDTTPHIVETWKSDDGLSWYRKYSDGWIVQKATVAYVANSVTVTFPVEFLDTSYSLQITSKRQKAYSGAQVLQLGYLSKSTTGFTKDMPVDSGYEPEFEYLAEGFVKE